MSSARPSPCDPFLDALEPRRLLSSDLAIIEWGGGLGPPTRRVIEGELGDDNSFVGAQYAPGVGAFGAPSAHTGLGTYADGGSFVLDETGGTAFDFDFGATGRVDQGSGAGWLHSWQTSIGGGAANNTSSVLVERAPQATLATLAGKWNVALISNSDTFGGSAVAFEGSLLITGNSAVMLSASLGGWGLFDASFTVTAGDRGKFVFDDIAGGGQAWTYLSADGHVLIGADGGVGDGAGFVMVAFRSSAPDAVNDQLIPGRYRMLAGFDTIWAAAQPWRDGSNAQVTDLIVNPDGSFLVTDLYRSDVLIGTWTSEDDRLDLVFGDTSKGVRTLSLFVTPNARSLLPYLDTTFGADSSVINGLFGLGARIDMALPPPPPVVDPDDGDDGDGDAGGGDGSDGDSGDGGLGDVGESRVPNEQAGLIVAGHADIDASGRPIAFYQNSANTWFRADLFDVAGLDPELVSTLVATGVETELDSVTGRLHVFVTVGPDLYLFFAGADGVWHANNLSEQLPGALAVGGAMTSFQHARAGALSTDLHVAATNATGDLILYSRVNSAWSVRNLGEALRGQGLTMPTFAGPLTSYVTRWGGLNVVGLDAEGSIESVWFSPGLSDWTTSNLSNITGAPAYTGSLTVYLTSWDGINVVGAVESGDLVASWWVPAFGGTWAVTNFQDLFGGPQLEATSITSYVTPWGGLNIVGLDSEGNLTVFWWVSSFAGTDNDFWRIASLEDVVEDGVDLGGEISALFSPLNQQVHLFGDTPEGAVARYAFVVETGEWLAENLDAGATNPFES